MCSEIGKLTQYEFFEVGKFALAAKLKVDWMTLIIEPTAHTKWHVVSCLNQLIRHVDDPPPAVVSLHPPAVNYNL